MGRAGCIFAFIAEDQKRPIHKPEFMEFKYRGRTSEGRFGDERDVAHKVTNFLITKHI